MLLARNYWTPDSLIGISIFDPSQSPTIRLYHSEMLKPGQQFNGYAGSDSSSTELSGSLLLNETFQDLSNWQNSTNGKTAVIKLQPRWEDPSMNQVLTNITYCGGQNISEYCYRSEMDVIPSLRPTLFPNTTVTYWLGFSFLIPDTWVIPDAADAYYQIDNFQIHGGYLDGNSPILAIRSANNMFQAAVCGNIAYDTIDTTTCKDYNLGPITTTGWHDWVINSRLAHGEPTGYVRIWRNQVLMCEEYDILTSYNSSVPPYIKFGTYDLNWKVGEASSFSWASVVYKAMKLGNADSSYDEVYTGDGTLCGAPCEIPFTNTPSGNGLFKFLGLTLGELLYVAIPPVIVLLVSLNIFVGYKSKQSKLLRRAKSIHLLGKSLPSIEDQNFKSNDSIHLSPAHDDEGVDDMDSGVYQPMLPPEQQDSGRHIRSSSMSGLSSRTLSHTDFDAKQNTLLAVDTSKHQLQCTASRSYDKSFRSSDSESRRSLSTSVRNSLSRTYDAIRDAIDQVEEIPSEKQQPDEHGQLWMLRSKLARKIFWYCFGITFCFFMLVVAVFVYGSPSFISTVVKPQIQWSTFQEWSMFEISAAVISTSLILIYDIPLFYMPHDLKSGKTFVNDPQFLARIGVVIPCHKSALEIGEVVRRVMKYIPPENIVICDNGNFDWPSDNTFEVVKAIHPKVRYLFIKQGHKTRALWTGVHRLPKQCEYIIHLDDDTHFSDNMVFDEMHFLADPNTISVGFLRSAHRLNRVTKFVDFWYRITDHFGATQSKTCTRCFVPGPAGMWRTDKFIKIFSHHPSLPFGEDIFGGFTSLNLGYSIAVETRCMVTTFSPPILININAMLGLSAFGRVQGYGAASIWKQRANRWTLSALRITGKSLYSFFTYDTRYGICSNLCFRLYRFREYKIIVIQLVYIPFCLILMLNGFYAEFITLKLMLLLLPLMRNIFINYVCWRGMKDLQVDLETVLLSPFYNLFLILCAVHGRLKCLLWYLPEVPANHGMLAKLIPAPLECVQLDNALEGENPDTFVGRNPIKIEDDQYSIKSHDSASTLSHTLAVTLENGTAAGKSFDNDLRSLSERWLLNRSDTFEIFDKSNGNSEIAIFTKAISK